MKIEVDRPARRRARAMRCSDRLIARPARARAAGRGRVPWLFNLRDRCPCWRGSASAGSACRRGARCRAGAATPSRVAPRSASSTRDDALAARKAVVLFVDTFNGNFEPENAHRRACACCRPPATRSHVADAADGARRCAAAARFLAAGWSTRRRREARRAARRAAAVRRRAASPIVGLEPSCLLTLRDEMLVDGPRRRRARRLAAQRAAVRGVPRARSSAPAASRSTLQAGDASRALRARPLPPEGVRRDAAGAEALRADPGRRSRADRD